VDVTEAIARIEKKFHTWFLWPLLEYVPLGDQGIFLCIFRTRIDTVVGYIVDVKEPVSFVVLPEPMFRKLRASLPMIQRDPPKVP
jgi:hypothetical protein